MNLMKVNRTNKAGFTLVEIMIVVAIIGLLAAIAIPNFVKARTTSQQNACINNLRQYDGAVQQWALENKKTSTDTYGMTSIQPYVKLDSGGNLRSAGFTLVEIMIVVAIIGLLAAIAIPNFVKARTTSQQNACINNLRQYDGAVQQWALENKKTSTDTYGMTSIQPYVKLDSGGNL